MVRPRQISFISELVDRLSLVTSLLPSATGCVTTITTALYRLFIEGNGIDKKLNSLRGLCLDKRGGIIPHTSLPNNIGFSSVCALMYGVVQGNLIPVRIDHPSRVLPPQWPPPFLLLQATTSRLGRHDPRARETGPESIPLNEHHI